MLCRSLHFAVGMLIVVGLLVSPSAGQEPLTQDLRKQIEALQEQLQRLEHPTEQNRRVTQLSGGRTAAREAVYDVRLYDLSDLFMAAPTYEAMPDGDLDAKPHPFFPRVTASAGGTGGMGGGGFFNAEDKPAGVGRAPAPLAQASSAPMGGNLSPVQTSLDDLIQAITSTISPTSWEEAGGPASIAKLGTSLIISAEARAHEQIEALLGQFRKRWGTLRTISVRAYWFWLTDERLTAILAPSEAQPGEASLRAFGLANPKAWQDLLAEAQPRPGYRGVVTCHNGQTVSTVSGSQSIVVSDVEPVVSKGGDDEHDNLVAYRPTTSVIHEGAALQVTPISNTSGRFVVLDIHSRVSALDRRAGAGREVGQRKAPGDLPSPRDVVNAIDRPVLVTQRLSTTLRVPVDRPILIGGLTSESDPAQGDANLYLFVVVSVQELRDDQPDRMHSVPAAQVDGEANGTAKPEIETPGTEVRHPPEDES